MIYELTDISKVEHLFEGREYTMVYSCLQKVMGKIYVIDQMHPDSAMAFVGSFVFLVGRPDKELVRGKPKGLTIMIPQNEEWSALIEACFHNAKKAIRYATRKDTKFDIKKLKRITENLPAGYELCKIDSRIYDMCIQEPATVEFVSAFSSKEQFLKIGRGMVVLKCGKIVSGASSYSRYLYGIEIEVDTIPEERRKGLASIACSALILACLDEGLYPSWDAQNIVSLHLAEKLGYVLDYPYTAYEVI